MDFGPINWLAVLVGGLVNIFIGATWFSEKAFFPVWWVAIGKSKTDQPGMKGANAMIMTFGITFIAAFVEVIFLSLMVTAMGKLAAGGATLVSGATTGFLLWLGFVATTSITNRVFAGQLKAWVLEAGYHLVNFHHWCDSRRMALGPIAARAKPIPQTSRSVAHLTQAG